MMRFSRCDIAAQMTKVMKVLNSSLVAGFIWGIPVFRLST